MTKKFVFECKIQVRWRDMDAFGHVNNSEYFTYFEQARAQWWDSINWPFSNKTEGPILITASCSFLKPLFYPATILIKLYVELPPGRSSYIIHYAVFTEEEPEILYAEGTTKVVWIDYQQHLSKPLPDFIRQYLL